MDTGQPAFLAEYNPLITRSNSTILDLPVSLEKLKIQPNTFSTSKNFNKSLSAYNQILEYFINSGTQMYDSTFPVFDRGEIYTTTDVIRDLTVGNNGAIYATISDRVVIMDSSGIPIREIVDAGRELFPDPPGTLKSVGVNSDYTIFILEDHIIHIYGEDGIQYQGFFGGFGGVSDKNLFNSPTTIHVDENDVIYVSDFGNKAVKIFNKNLSHLSTITFGDNPIDVTTDASNIYILLKGGKIVVYSKVGYTYVKNIDSGFDANAIRITHDNLQPGFLFVSNSQGTVRKMTIGGVHINSFNVPSGATGIEKFQSLLYVGYGSSINQYREYTQILDIMDRSILTNITSYEIKKEEFVSSWTYNRALKTLANNLNLIVSAISGRFVATVDRTDTFISNGVSALDIPCDIYPIDCNLCIGSNEFVTYEVMCRPFQKLYLNAIDILDKLQIFKIRNISNLDCHTWAYLRCDSSGFPTGETNPISWVELKDVMWGELTGCCSCVDITGLPISSLICNEFNDNYWKYRTDRWNSDSICCVPILSTC